MSFNDSSSAAPKASASEEIVVRWRAASKEQDQILSDLLARNLELEAQVKELEYVNWRLRDQLKDYKAEVRVQKGEKDTLKSELDIVQSENESFKVCHNCSAHVVHF